MSSMTSVIVQNEEINEEHELPFIPDTSSIRGNEFEYLDVTASSHGSTDDLNSIDGGFVELSKGSTMTATMSDHVAQDSLVLSVTITVRYGGEKTIGGKQIIQAWDSANGVAFKSQEFSSSDSMITVTMDCPVIDDWTEIDDLQVKITNNDKGKAQNAWIDYIDVEIVYQAIPSGDGPIEVATVNPGSSLEAGRNIARDSSGIWYVFYHDGRTAYTAYLAVSDDTTPTSFNNIQLTNTGGIIDSDHVSIYGALYIDEHDILHIIYVDRSTSPESVIYSRSDTSTGCDDPFDWTHADGITQGGEVVDTVVGANDPQLAVHYNGDITIVYAGSGIHSKRYSGNAWGERETIATNDWCVRPNIAIDSKDNAHVVWRDTYGPTVHPYDVHYKFRKASTGTWRNCADTSNEPDIIYAEVQANNRYPSIAVDSDDVIWIVFEDDSFSIQYNTGTIGTGWNGNLQVATGSDRAGQLGIMPNGKPIVVFRRNGDIMYNLWTGTDWGTSSAIDTTGSNGSPRIERHSRFGTIGIIYSDSEPSPDRIYFNKVTLEDPIAAIPNTIQTIPAINEINQFDDVEFQVGWTHIYGLQAYRFSWDESGSWVTDPWTIDRNWGNDVSSIVTKTVMASPGSSVNWKIEVRDIDYNVWSTDIQSFQVGNPSEILSIVLTSPNDGDNKLIDVPFSIDGTIESLPGTMSEDVNAFVQILPVGGSDWIDMTSSTDIKIDGANQKSLGTLGGYWNPEDIVQIADHQEEVHFDSTVESYSGTGGLPLASIKIGYEEQANGGTQALDVSSTTIGTPEQLNNADDNSIKVRKNKNVVATMSDVIPTGAITGATIYIRHKEASRASGYLRVEAIDSSTGRVIDSTQFSPSSTYIADTFSISNIDSWSEVNNLQIRVSNRCNKDTFIDLVDIDISYTHYKIFRDYLNFDTPQIPNGAIINSATFEFSVNTAGGSADLYSSGDFDDSVADETIYSTSNDLVEAWIDTSTVGLKSVDVTQEIMGAIDGGQNYYSFQLRESLEDALFQIDGTGPSEPTLVISYSIPNPTSIPVQWSATGITLGNHQLRIRVVHTNGSVTSTEPIVHIIS